MANILTGTADNVMDWVNERAPGFMPVSYTHLDVYKRQPPYSETRRYVERVRVLAERYRGALAGRG